jgi:hypothetical protein
MASAAAERIVRREFAVVSKAKDSAEAEAAYLDHSEFIADALGVTLNAAIAYCTQRVAQYRAGQDRTVFESLARSSLERLALTGTTT